LSVLARANQDSQEILPAMCEFVGCSYIAKGTPRIAKLTRKKDRI